jgi:hypothetical protein
MTVLDHFKWGKAGITCCCQQLEETLLPPSADHDWQEGEQAGHRGSERVPAQPSDCEHRRHTDRRNDAIAQNAGRIVWVKHFSKRKRIVCGLPGAWARWTTRVLAQLILWGLEHHFPDLDRCRGICTHWNRYHNFALRHGL